MGRQCCKALRSLRHLPRTKDEIPKDACGRREERSRFLFAMDAELRSVCEGKTGSTATPWVLLAFGGHQG